MSLVSLIYVTRKLLEYQLKHQLSNTGTMAVKIFQEKNDFHSLVSLCSIHVDVFDRVVPVLVKSHLKNLNVLKSLARLAGNTNTKQNIIDRFVSWKNENCESLAMSLLNNNNKKKDTLRVAKIIIQRIMSRCSEPNKMMKRACDLIGSNEIATTIIGSAPRNVKIEYEMYERLIEDKDTDIALAARLNKEKDEAILSKVRGVRVLVFECVTVSRLHHRPTQSNTCTFSNNNTRTPRSNTGTETSER